MNFRGAFWRFAHKRYQIRKPNLSWEITAYMWLVIAIPTYVFPLATDLDRYWKYLLPGIVAIGMPLVLALLHRRIRLERAKGSPVAVKPLERVQL
jgi:hypothetical protein